MTIHPAGIEVKTRFTVKVPIFQFNVVVEIGNIRELAKRWTADDVDYDGCRGVVIETGQGFAPVVIFSPDVTPVVVVHECLHLTHKVFKHIGHNPSLDDDEPHAYLLSYLFEAIWSKVEKKQIGFNK